MKTVGNDTSGVHTSVFSRHSACHDQLPNTTRMKTILTFLLILAIWHIGDPQTSTISTRGKCVQPKFHYLNRYKDERWWRVFTDVEVAPALKALLKTSEKALRETLKEASYPDDTLAYVDKSGVLTLEGGVPGLYTIMEARLVIEPCGNIYAAILDNGERFLYFTNDRKQGDRLPPDFEHWRAKIEAARSQPRSVPELPVVMKSN